METSKRRQIPTTNASQNFTFRGIRIKKNFVTLKKTTSVTLKAISVTLRKYTLVSSGNGQFNTRTRARFYYGCSRPGLRPDSGCAGIICYSDVGKETAKLLHNRVCHCSFFRLVCCRSHCTLCLRIGIRLKWKTKLEHANFYVESKNTFTPVIT